MPELCRRLTAATGVTHVSGDLRDYPVFVSVRGADPKRVESLVADALGGEWQRDGAGVRLVRAKPKPNEGFAEFERQFRLAAKGRDYLPALPLDELYRLPPGSQVRYGYPSGPLFRPFPKAFAAKLAATPGAWGRVMVRREGYGYFSVRQDFPDRTTGVFTPGGSIQFRELPADVAAYLRADLSKGAMTPEEAAAVGKMMNDPAELKVDWRALDRTDPIATFADAILKKAAEKVAPDLVVALPDLSMMALPGGEDGGTVGSVLGAYSAAVEWHVVDGAVVGRLPETERNVPTQTRRGVVSTFVANAKAHGISSPLDFANYLAAQRPGASDTWADVLLLVMAGVVVDDANIGDHPYNLRLANRFTPQDWAAVRSEKPFPATALSGPARTALNELLLSAKTRLQSEKPDPATWPSLAPNRLLLEAKIVEQDVLICWSGFAAQVVPLRNAYSGHERSRAQLGREPLYQPAHRRRLILSVLPMGGTEETVETGFSEVVPLAGTKPTPWSGLPKAIRKTAQGPVDVEAAPPAASGPPRG